MLTAGQFDDDPEKIHKDMHDTAWLSDRSVSGSDEDLKFMKAHHEARAKYEKVTGKSPIISINDFDSPLCSHCGEMF